MPEMTFVLNGESLTAAYEEGMTFLEVLRDVCGITSASRGDSMADALGIGGAHLPV